MKRTARERRNRKQTLAFCVLVILIAFWAHALFLGPGRGQLQSMTEELMGLRHRNLQLEVGESALENTIQDLKHLSSAWSESARTLTHRDERVQLLLQLDTLCRKSGIQLTGLRPEDIVSAPGWLEWPIRLEGTGTFRSLQNLLEELNRLELVAATRHLEIRRLTRPSAGHSIEVVITLCFAISSKEFLP